MNDSEQDDPAWKLLSAARKVKPSPYFSRNVVREVRQLNGRAAGETRGLWASIERFFRNPAVSIAGAAAAIVLLVVLFSTYENAGSSSVAHVPAAPVSETPFNPAEELGNIEYLGQLMTVENPDDLDDETLADLILLAGR